MASGRPSGGIHQDWACLGELMIDDWQLVIEEASTAARNHQSSIINHQ
jgi:hypothetical protein